MKTLSIDHSWSLFLDRDGVINKKIEGDYVRNIHQFEWLPKIIGSIVFLSSLFRRTFIVSNQQGIGKGLMSDEDVSTIHEYILAEIIKNGGRVDKIYFAPQLKSENSVFRKPNIGMALQAKQDYPEISLTKSVMVGDSMSDMEFGKRAGMKTILLNPLKKFSPESNVDYCFMELSEFADFLRLQ
ncbi:MAG: HAD family hydrolase [Chitinophagales bacterium]|nr:HAD family hydrolase [Chitinophagales bacterium]